jgi:hypothetical protein
MMSERIEELVYEIASERADEIRAEMGYDEDLHDLIEDTLRALDGKTREIVKAMVDRMESERLDDYVKVYRGAFRDGLRYAFELVKDTE